MDLFGQTLSADPAVALHPPRAMTPLKTGPLHKVQYVIEFVGPRSVPASTASSLLSQQWYSALGEPYAFAMAPADQSWQALVASDSGSYDSLAIAWDILSPRGELSSSAAMHLLKTAESFASHIDRRAMALPIPNDLESARQSLLELRENLDIGYGVAVMARSGAVSERDLWIECARLGLSMDSLGAFTWMPAGAATPLFELTPLGAHDSFSLAAVQQDRTHPGVSLGFSVPLSLAPLEGLEALFRTAEHLASSFGGFAFDESEQGLTDAVKDRARENLRLAVQALERSGLTPGSAEAIRLFSEL